MGRRRGDPRRWLLSVALALVLLAAGVLGTPRSWLGFLLPTDAELRERNSRRDRPWLVLQPPPEIETAPVREDEPPLPSPSEPPPPADWWREGWRVRVAAATREALAPTADDSVTYLIETLGLPRDLHLRVRPDSVLAARLVLLRREESFRFDELKPYFQAVARSRLHSDMQSRKAAMYDDHLGAEIMVPD
ncbi:MAG: hypothetical protein GY838_08215 [bacterium]|nr:hypothetical protein [bacterium]